METISRFIRKVTYVHPDQFHQLKLILAKQRMSYSAWIREQISSYIDKHKDLI